MPPLHPSSKKRYIRRLALVQADLLLYSLLLFKQKLLGLERQQIKLMGLMQTLSISAIQNNRSRGPHMFLHEDIRTGSDRGHC